MHFLLVLLTSFFLLSLISAPAQAAVKRAYAGIVVDAKTGKTLYARAADAQRYPASIVKVMTLYILFQELEAGRLKLSTKMRVSKYAANAVPSKLGLKPGSSISVENAIKALITKSANDVARVVAEHISGSESKFAQRMTKTARALGMKRTVYKNASGLPNSRQITTVRDQARLGIAIYQHFPKYYKYFQTRIFRYKGRSYGNHNRLLGRNGIDGIKTGYIRASGFNLLTAARKNNRHIVVVAFGFDSGSKRNATVASLVNKYLPKARRGNYLAQAKIAKPGLNGEIIRVAVKPVIPRPRLASRMNNLPKNNPANMRLAANIPVPAPRPINLLMAREKKNQPAISAPINLATINNNQQNRINLAQNNSQTLIDANNDEPIDIIGAWISDRIALSENDNNNMVMLPPVGIGVNGKTNEQNNSVIDLMTSGSIAQNTQHPKKEELVKEIRSWKVQIGTTNSQQTAQEMLLKASEVHQPLKNLRALVEISEKNGQNYYRARFVGFGSIEQAQQACKKLNEKEISCLAMNG